MRRLIFRNNIAILFLFTLFVLFISAKSVQNDPIVILGNARFTVITPMCIRIEYAENGNFVDNKTLFAENRNSLNSNFELIISEKEIFINTGVIKLRYKANGKPFSKDNLTAVIKNGNREVEWFPGLKNKQNLGGTLTTLDGVDHAVKVDDGLLSRDG